MQKTSTWSDDYPQKSRPEAEGYVGVQTYMRVVDGCLTTIAHQCYRKVEEPPYAEPLVRWCERTSEHEKRRTPLISVHLLLDLCIGLGVYFSSTKV